MIVRHPIRGFLSGVLLGIGLALVMVQLSFVPFGGATVIVVVVAGAILGVAFAMLVPARGASTMETSPPARHEPPPEAQG